MGRSLYLWSHWYGSMPNAARWYDLALAALATWRLTHLLAKEDGPWDTIASLRQRMGDGFPGRLMDCFYCLSLWISAPFAFVLANGWRRCFLLWLGLSGAACLLERFSDREPAVQMFSQEKD
jgi:hypothetical protein